MYTHSYPYTYDSYNNNYDTSIPNQNNYYMPNSYGINYPNICNQINDTKDSIKNPYNLELYPKEYINIIKAGLKWDDGNWSSCDELSLKKKLMYCYVRKEAHWDLAVNFNNYAKYLEVPKIILSSVLSTSLFVNATDTTHFSNTMQFINAGIGTSLAILVGIDSYAKFSQLHTRHKNTSLEYGKLSAKIERLLQAKPDERQSFSIVLSKIDEKYSKIKEEAPFISQDKIKEFIALFNSSNSCYDYVNSKIKTKISFEDDEEQKDEEQKDEEEQIKPTQSTKKEESVNQSPSNSIWNNTFIDNSNFTEIPLHSPDKNKSTNKYSNNEPPVNAFVMSLNEHIDDKHDSSDKLYSHNEKEEYHDCDTDSNIV